MPPLDLGLGPLATRALAIRRRVFRYPAQVTFDSALWPCWWSETTSLRAIAYLRVAGVEDDGVEAAIVLVGCVHRDREVDAQITGLGGEVAMATRLLKGRPSDYPGSYWRELREEAFAEHRLARAAIQVALLDDALDWPAEAPRRRKVIGDARWWVLPMLAGMPGRAATALGRMVVERLGMLGNPLAVE